MFNVKHSDQSDKRSTAAWYARQAALAKASQRVRADAERKKGRGR